jgi:hypothetical protein
MPGAPSEQHHRREAERFDRLSKMASDPELKAKLSHVALLHSRIADELAAAGRDKVRCRAKPARHYEARLICEDGAVTATVDADSDIQALRICYALHDACADLCDRFELRDGPRLIAKSGDRRSVRRPNGSEALDAQSQAEVLKLEELLLDSQRAIASSRRLLEATARFRSSTLRDRLPPRK